MNTFFVVLSYIITIIQGSGHCSTNTSLTGDDVIVVSQKVRLQKLITQLRLHEKKITANDGLVKEFRNRNGFSLD